MSTTEPWQKRLVTSEAVTKMKALLRVIASPLHSRMLARATLTPTLTPLLGRQCPNRALLSVLDRCAPTEEEQAAGVGAKDTAVVVPTGLEAHRREEILGVLARGEAEDTFAIALASIS